MVPLPLSIPTPTPAPHPCTPVSFKKTESPYMPHIGFYKKVARSMICSDLLKCCLGNIGILSWHLFCTRWLFFETPDSKKAK